MIAVPRVFIPALAVRPALVAGLLLGAAMLARTAPARAGNRCGMCMDLCDGKFAGARAGCKTFICQEDYDRQSHDCFVGCVGDQLLDCEAVGGNRLGRHGLNRRRLIDLRHRHAPLPKWSLAAAIAEVAQHLTHSPHSVCDVAGALDRAGGGSGGCCSGDGRPSKACFARTRPGAGSSVMSDYFGTRARESDRAFPWSDVKHAIDEGLPLIVLLHEASGPFGGTTYGAVVVGYDAGGHLLIDDPRDDRRTIHALAYRELANRHGGLWRDGWILRNSVGVEPAGATSGPLPVDPPATRPAASRVDFSFPDLHDAAVQSVVEAWVVRHAGAFRSCYEAAFSPTIPIVSPAKLVFSFAVRRGTPEWIVIKSDGGVAASVTACVSDDLARAEGMFPESFDDSQTLAVTFSVLQPARVPVPGRAKSG